MKILLHRIFITLSSCVWFRCSRDKNETGGGKDSNNLQQIPNKQRTIFASERLTNFDFCRFRISHLDPAVSKVIRLL